MEFPIYGKEGDNIKHISFNKTNNYFSVSFTKGDIPIWSLKKAKELIHEPFDENDKTTNIHGFIFFIQNEQPFNCVNLENYNNPNYEAFKLGDKNSLYIITSDCHYIKIKFENSYKTQNKNGYFILDDYRYLFKKKLLI